MGPSTPQHARPLVAISLRVSPWDLPTSCPRSLLASLLPCPAGPCLAEATPGREDGLVAMAGSHVEGRSHHRDSKEVLEKEFSLSLVPRGRL